MFCSQKDKSAKIECYLIDPSGQNATLQQNGTVVETKQISNNFVNFDVKHPVWTGYYTVEAGLLSETIQLNPPRKFHFLTQVVLIFG